MVVNHYPFSKMNENCKADLISEHCHLLTIFRRLNNIIMYTFISSLRTSICLWILYKSVIGRLGLIFYVFKLVSMLQTKS